MLSKLSYKFNIIPIKVPAEIFEDSDKLILKAIWKDKVSWIPKTTLKKEEQNEEGL